MENQELVLEVADAILEMGGEDLTQCFGCGTCTGLCPWNLVAEFNVRGMIRTGMLGLDPPDPGDVWKCATCGYCVANCPRQVDIIGVFRSMRRMSAEMGSVPKTLRAMLGSQHDNGNPWGGKAEDRNAWTRGRDIPVYENGMEYAYYPCCTSCYDSENMKNSVALTEVLKASGVKYGLTPAEAVCCGDGVRETGDDELQATLAARNKGVFEERGIHKVVTSSPHCYNAFLKDYPKFDANIEPVHYAVLLAERLQTGDLKLSGKSSRKATYHDPCYLGRHNGIYDEPRQVLENIPGLEFTEMPRHRENAICCGGGGGGMFMEAETEQSMADIRVQEAVETGADTLVTACPYCYAMFSASIKSRNLDDRIEVKDLADLVREVL